MYKLKTIVYVAIRSYGKWIKAGIRSKINLQKSVGEKINFDNFDEHDLDEFEVEFMCASEFHRNHKREREHMKQLFKHQITASKYFKKDKDPNFLTSVEKDQIKSLHEKDPEKWTVERLSESFPALPNTVKKVLKAKWIPSSSENIIKYDKTVIENWKLFCQGKLALEAELIEHLEKFKHRKITISDRHLIAEKLIPLKTELAKPKSQLFSNIIRSYLVETESKNNDQKVLADTEHPNTKQGNIAKDNIDRDEFSKSSKKLHISNERSGAFTLNLSHAKTNVKVDKTRYTFVDFAKKHLPRIYKECPEEGITLLETYKKYLQCQNLKEQSCSQSNTKQNTTYSKNVEKSEKEGTSMMYKNENATLQISPMRNNNDSQLETFVKSWDKKTLDTVNYMKSIKIPKKMYKTGQIYRIKDCYYAHDGEFLYRVPGVWG